MTETQAPYHVNPLTGEVFEDEPEDEETGLTVIDPSQPGNLVPSITNLPLHFKAMQLEKYTPEEQAEKIFQSTEYTGRVAIPLKRYANKEIEVIGGAMIWHPPYKGKTDHPDAPLRPGYYKAHLRLEDGTIVETAGWRITQMLAALLPALGWFDWPISVTFYMEVDDNNAQYLRRVVKK